MSLRSRSVFWKALSCVIHYLRRAEASLESNRRNISEKQGQQCKSQKHCSSDHIFNVFSANLGKSSLHQKWKYYVMRLSLKSRFRFGKQRRGIDTRRCPGNQAAPPCCRRRRRRRRRRRSFMHGLAAAAVKGILPYKIYIASPGCQRR